MTSMQQMNGTLKGITGDLKKRQHNNQNLKSHHHPVYALLHLQHEMRNTVTFNYIDVMFNTSK